MKTWIATVLLFVAWSSAAAEAPLDQERLSGAAMLAFSGKHEEARPQLEKALAAYRAEKNAFGEGVSLVLLGIVDIAAQKSTIARLHLEEGAAILREAGDFITSFLALWMLAELDTSEGKLQASLVRHGVALSVLEAASSPDAPFKLDGLVLLGPAVGMDMKSLDVMQSAAGIMKPMFLMMFEAMARDSYGKHLTAVGNFKEAEEQLIRARAAGKMFGMFDQSIEAHLGDLRRRQWRFDEAREHYKNALNQIVPMPIIPERDEWITVRSLGQLAQIEQLRGRVDEALAWNDQALAIVRKSKNRKREASVLEARGELLLAVSRFDDGEKAFLEALAVAEATGDVYHQATVTSSLGNLYFMRGDLGRAASTFEKSLPLLEKADAEVVSSVTLLTLAEVYMGLGAEDAARDTLKRARALAKEKEFPPAEKFADVVQSMIDTMSGREPSRSKKEEFISSWWELPETGDLMVPTEFRDLLRDVMGLERPAVEQPSSDAEAVRAAQLPAVAAMRGLVEGKRLFQQGNTAAARAVWQKSLEQNKTKELAAPFLAAVGATYWREGKLDDAARQFELAVQAVGVSVDDVKVEELLAGYLGSERRWYFDMAIHSLVRQGRIADAFDHAERARARAFLHSVANARLQPAHGGEPALVGQAEALRKRIAAWQLQSAFQSAETAEDLRNARAEYQMILKRVKASNPEYASLTSVEPLGVEEVQRELPPDTTMISYFVGVDVVHAWIIDPQTLKYVSLPLTRQQLEKVACWAVRIQGGDTVRSMDAHDEQCGDGTAAEDAYRLLIEPLRKSVRNPRLLVVPHGVLHYVPFAALRSPDTNRYLLEDYTITYSPSASALQFLREKETPMNGSALVLGDPVATSGDRLAGAQREANAVGRALGTVPKVGEAAAESLLYGLGGKYDVVHIAAHALYDAATPLFSHVALAKDARADGRLEVNDILSAVDFRGVNLVVLSACGTARGSRSGGDEIVGLTRAVLYAGTPGVISTLWDVDDDATADLMIAMYEDLRNGASVADALRGAQLSVMKRKPYTDPRFWAAFQLNGDPQGRWPKAVGAQ